jgi:spore germination protein YaaH
MSDSEAKRLLHFTRGWRASALQVSLPAGLLITSLVMFGREPRLVTQFYLVNDPSSVQSFEANYTRISVLSPQWFSIDEKGNLESTIDSTIVEWAAGKGVPLMPLVLNQKFLPAAAHAVLGDASLRSHALERLMEIAAGSHFWGFQFDFENIPAEDRDRYSEFIHRAADEFRRNHLRLSVAVPPPLTPPPAANASVPPASSGWITNVHSLAFDYRSIANDAYFISLMTYDEYASPEQPGPVAGRPWVEACLHKTLESVPAKKLLLGIPLYYREWSGKSVNEGSVRDAQNLAARWKANIVSDPEQHESFFSFSDGQQQHYVWLQDNQSVSERLDMAAQFRLAGISAWRLGFEDPTAWETSLRIAAKKIH